VVHSQADRPAKRRGEKGGPQKNGPEKGVAGRAVGWGVEGLGDYLKEQRLAARLSLRQLAEQAGVSNPYLSQIERGLRRPSADVLQQIAKALRLSAEQVYVRAGLLQTKGATEVPVVEVAILHDPTLSDRQKQSLLDVYTSFVSQRSTTGSDEPGDVRPR
jgi:transcriptional regulator with XRE-family HTH domain